MFFGRQNPAAAKNAAYFKDFFAVAVFAYNTVGIAWHWAFGEIDNFRNFITYNTAAVSGQLGAG